MSRQVESIENPGQGNCGYYAFAIGLIEQIQKQFKQTGHSALFDTWQAYGLSNISLEAICAINLVDLNTPSTFLRQLLDKLQRSLRLISHMQAVEDLSVENSSILQKFHDVINGVADPLVNELLCVPVKKLIRDNRLRPDSTEARVREVFYANIYQRDGQLNPHSVILSAARRMTQSSHWASFSELQQIAKAFDVELREARHDRLAAHRPVITLINHRQNHWTTQLETPIMLAAQPASRPSLKTMTKTQQENYQQVLHSLFVQKAWMAQPAKPSKVRRLSGETDDAYAKRQHQIHADEVLARKLQIEELKQGGEAEAKRILTVLRSR